MSAGNVTTREALILIVAVALAAADGKFIDTVGGKVAPRTPQASVKEVAEYFTGAREIVDGK
ncbi:hypothetical protein [Gluconobacter sphaericus]|uniref:hypothetical protein n=1 Tax=Gluconobacter sphaericus TaxID=574987 RepID=UPI00312BC9A5